MTLSKDSKFDLWINSNELSEGQMKDKAFGFLMNMIDQKLKQTKQNTEEKSNPKEMVDNKPKTIMDEYEEFYYPDGKKRKYDFDNQGVDYPDKDKKSDSSDSDSDSDNVFMGTVKE
jgi:hypothetical protein